MNESSPASQVAPDADSQLKQQCEQAYDQMKQIAFESPIVQIVVAKEAEDGTLRMILAAITTEEVSGKQARQLSDQETMQVLTREAKKRKVHTPEFKAKVGAYGAICAATNHPRRQR